jgi:hypothetical protein
MNVDHAEAGPSGADPSEDTRATSDRSACTVRNRSRASISFTTGLARPSDWPEPTASAP